ncbi:SSI family serine proteinase inhibitor [Nocardia sp. NPDC003482]
MRSLTPIGHLAAAATILTALFVSAGSAAADRPDTQLTFTRTDPDQPSRTVTLTCAPTGGNHPAAEAACAALATADLTLPEENQEVRCFRYYPVTLRAEGTLRGQPISIEKTYGCLVPELTDPWRF